MELLNLSMLHQPMNKIKFLTTNLQDAPESSAVFYKLNTQKNVDSFNARLSLSKALVVYIYCSFKDPVGIAIDKRVILLNEDKFEDKKQELINLLYPDWIKPKVIGITGTNGKSSVVHFLQTILNKNGHSAISVGTVGIIQMQTVLAEDIGATTPSEIDLKRILHEHSNKEYVCLEVSSHALDQGRTSGIHFVAAGFTNLSQDHLDYHLTMESYFQAKFKITEQAAILVIPPNEVELEKKLKVMNANYTVADIIDTTNMRECFLMEYNIKNLSLAIDIVKKVTRLSDLSLESLEPPKGRFTSYSYKNSIYVVDYAHTPDAIFNLLSESKKSFPDYKIITVFGCGGDRDKTKRPKMLASALEFSDKVIVTTDNPRTEDPVDIINDIILGEKNNSKISIEINRELAIKKIVLDYPDKTLVLVAGKGHEEYQDINGKKEHFSDMEQIEKNIENLKNANR